jgi:hypothetical protein
MPLKNGSNFVWRLADPFNALQQLVQDAPTLASLYLKAKQAAPPSPLRPWHLVVAWDEFTPGNKLQSDPARKCMVVSYTFRELGQDAIASGLAWVTPAVVRAPMIREVAGGWPHFLKRFLLRILLGPNGLASSGFPLAIGAESCPIFAKVANLISDGDGLRAGLDWKGHASLKPCLCHFNVWRKDSFRVCAQCVWSNLGLQNIQTRIHDGYDYYLLQHADMNC